MGMSNCIGGDSCTDIHFEPGKGLDVCRAIHAEQNALLQCPDVYTIEKAYVTTSPCITCTKLLLNTSCKEIIFLEDYPGEEAKRLWEMSGRTWTKNKEDLSIAHEMVKEFALID
jgi:dCMP deaminase